MDAFSVPATNVIVVGASAGGVSAVRTLLKKFPADVPAAIFVVVHTSPDGPGILASVLDRATELTVVTPEDGMVVRHGHVYVARPDYHLIIDGQHIRLTRGPREHRFRPAVDPLFQRLTAFTGSLDHQIADLKTRAAALRTLLLDTPVCASTQGRRARKRQSHG